MEPLEFIGRDISDRKRRVLFVCYGNSCRSQMAEAFARRHAGEFMEAFSAGLLPSSRVSNRARQIMAERGVPLPVHAIPKPLSSFDLETFDLIVNLSEYALPRTSTPVLRIDVPDARLAGLGVLREIRDEIEERVIGIGDQFRASGACRPALVGQP